MVVPVGAKKILTSLCVDRTKAPTNGGEHVTTIAMSLALPDYSFSLFAHATASHPQAPMQ